MRQSSVSKRRIGSKFVSCVASAALAFSMVPAMALGGVRTAEAATTDFSWNGESVSTLPSNPFSGSGTSSDPYKISNATDVAELVYAVSQSSSDYNKAGVYYELEGNLTLSSSWKGIGSATSENNSKGTSSVSSSSKAFQGTFDGNGKTVTLSGSSNGLFNYVGISGEVQNFTVAQASGTSYGVSSSSSGDYVAAVAAYNRGQVKNVTNKAAVNASSAYNVGGIVGFNDGYNEDGTTSVEHCTNAAVVTGKQKVGGIVGENAGTIAACTNSGTIKGTNTSSKNGVGGIAGRNGNNNTAYETGIITACYNGGSVGSSGQKWTGGIAGFQNSKSRVTDSVATGTIVSSSSNSNPIVGNNENASATKNNYSLSTLSYTGSSAAERGNAMSVAELKSESVVTSLNNSTDKTINSGSAWVYSSGKYPSINATATVNAPLNSTIKASTGSKYVYIDGEYGNDANSGKFDVSAVKTLARAKELLAEGGPNSMLCITGTVFITGNESLFGPYELAWEWDGEGTMFKVTGGTLTIGGAKIVGSGCTTVFDIDGGTVQLRNNTTVSGGAYAADVSAGEKSLQLNNATLSKPVKLVSGSTMYLTSALTSKLTVECNNMSAGNTIATAYSEDIASDSASMITVSNSGLAAKASGKDIKLVTSSAKAAASASKATVSVAKAASAPKTNAAAEAVSVESLDNQDESTTTMLYESHYAENEDDRNADLSEYASDTVPDGWVAFGGDAQGANSNYTCVNSTNQYVVDGTAHFRIATSIGMADQTSDGGTGDDTWLISPKATLGSAAALSFKCFYNRGAIMGIYLCKADGNSYAGTSEQVSSDFNIDLGTVTLSKATKDELGGYSGRISQTFTKSYNVDLSSYTGDYYIAFRLSRSLGASTYSHGLELGDISVTSSSAPVVTKHAVKVAEGITGGTVSTDVAEAAEGDKVTVTATPDSGYSLGSVSVEGADGAAVKVAEDGTFTMPSGDVTVSATFLKDCTVAFDANGGTLAAGTEAQTVKSGEKATEPAVPTYADHTFMGWSTVKGDYDRDKVFDFEATKIESDVTLYAMWTTDKEEPAAPAAKKAAKSFTVNVKTVTAKAVAKAAKKAGATTKSATSITLGSKVKTIKKGAFKSYKKVKTIKVKTKKLTKKSVKNCLKSSKVKTVKVQVSKKAKTNKKYVKTYKKVFAKSVVGKKVTVKK